VSAFSHISESFIVAIATKMANAKKRVKPDNTGGSKMKKLLLASALAVGLSFPLSSQAEVSAFGVQLPVERTQVSDNIRGGYVATDFGNTLKVQRLHNSEVEEVKASTENENVYSVFGVNISGDQII
jgi:hypothetical protein